MGKDGSIFGLKLATKNQLIVNLKFCTSLFLSKCSAKTKELWAKENRDLVQTLANLKQSKRGYSNSDQTYYQFIELDASTKRRIVNCLNKNYRQLANRSLSTSSTGLCQIDQNENEFVVKKLRDLSVVGDSMKSNRIENMNFFERACNLLSPSSKGFKDLQFRELPFSPSEIVIRLEMDDILNFFKLNGERSTQPFTFRKLRWTLQFRVEIELLKSDRQLAVGLYCVEEPKQIINIKIEFCIINRTPDRRNQTCTHCFNCVKGKNISCRPVGFDRLRDEGFIEKDMLHFQIALFAM